MLTISDLVQSGSCNSHHILSEPSILITYCQDRSSCRFKRGTNQYLGADDEDESEQADRASPASSPDKAQVKTLCVSSCEQRHFCSGSQLSELRFHCITIVGTACMQ